MGFLSGSGGKESACNAGHLGLIPGGKMHWRREWLPTPILLSRELHGQRSLARYSPRDSQELDTTEQLTLPPFLLDRSVRCSQVLHLQIQPAEDPKYFFRKFQNVPKTEF